MINRLYINNFRGLDNFELVLKGNSSVLLIGKNGSGKSTVGWALQIFQSVARGTNRVNELVRESDFTRGRMDAPIRFEIEIELENQKYVYVLAFERLAGTKELRVFEERLSVEGRAIYSRTGAQVVLAAVQPKEAEPKVVEFLIDWHLVALPIVQQSETDPLSIFKRILSRIVILRPVPFLMDGESNTETLTPDDRGKDLGAWFAGLMALAPAEYSRIDEYLKTVMPDLKDVRNPTVGTDARQLTVQFARGSGSLSLPVKDLSDGEKCFLLCALLLASNAAYGPLMCFWDEPDNYIGLLEAGRFVLTIRRAFEERGQFVATSHNPEAIRAFSDENTILLSRRSHLEPTQSRSLDELRVNGDLVDALIRGDVEI